MHISFTETNYLNLESCLVSLKEAKPVLNGEILGDWVGVIVENDDDKVLLKYHSPGSNQLIFGFEIHVENTGKKISYRAKTLLLANISRTSLTHRL